MPKQKTHQGVKARFKITRNKRVLARKSHANHNLSKKKPARKRTFQIPKVITGKISKQIKEN
ncbi:MAG: 50S ribosomal protein L35 [Candidatus Saccharibacteria bacterium]|nr:50S ribosomal protein L35 [Candidatus Saccharibacteria bacterium]MCY4010811.1 50S ribosomal protein L35 [Candidatus Saccharibacteria bacterium]MCY4088964.1 50S ribosomal protein L35 [Candidatus Saccharibacteria bacterium]